MNRIGRWLTAIVTTIATFTVVTWIGGGLILATFMKDAAIRWGVAGALGVAVAALAALWGHSFVAATSEDVSRGNKQIAGPDLASADTRNVITDGTFCGPVIQGRDVSISGLDFGRVDESRDDGRAEC